MVVSESFNGFVYNTTGKIKKWRPSVNCDSVWRDCTSECYQAPVLMTTLTRLCSFISFSSPFSTGVMDYVVMNRIQFESVVRDLLLIHLYRVEVYNSKSGQCTAKVPCFIKNKQICNILCVLSLSGFGIFVHTLHMWMCTYCLYRLHQIFCLPGWGLREVKGPIMSWMHSQICIVFHPLLMHVLLWKLFGMCFVCLV